MDIRDNNIEIDSFVFTFKNDKCVEDRTGVKDKFLKFVSVLEKLGLGNWDVLRDGSDVILRINFDKPVIFQSRESLMEEYNKWVSVLDNISKLFVLPSFRLIDVFHNNVRDGVSLIKSGNESDFLSVSSNINRIIENVKNFDKRDSVFVVNWMRVDEFSSDLYCLLKPFVKNDDHRLILMGIISFLRSYTVFTDYEFRDVIRSIVDLFGFKDTYINDFVDYVFSYVGRGDYYLYLLSGVFDSVMLNVLLGSLFCVLSRYSYEIKSVRYVSLVKWSSNKKVVFVQSDDSIKPFIFRVRGKNLYVEEYFTPTIKIEPISIKHISADNYVDILYTLKINDFVFRDVRIEDIIKSLHNYGLFVNGKKVPKEYVRNLLEDFGRDRGVFTHYFFYIIRPRYEGKYVGNFDCLYILHLYNIELDSVNLSDVYDLLVSLDDLTLGLVVPFLFVPFFISTDDFDGSLMFMVGSRKNDVSDIIDYVINPTFVMDSIYLSLSDKKLIDFVLSYPEPKVFEYVKGLDERNVRIVYDLYKSGELKTNVIVVPSIRKNNKVRVPRDALLYVRKDNRRVTCDSESIKGWGYLVLRRIFEYLNKNGVRVRDLLDSEMERFRFLGNEKRVKGYSQVSVVLKLLYNVLDDEKVKERIKDVYDRLPDIVSELPVKSS